MIHHRNDSASLQRENSVSCPSKEPVAWSVQWIFHCGWPQLPFSAEGMLRFHQIKIIIIIVVHTQILDRRITLTVVSRIDMDTANVIFDSVLLMFLPSQKLSKSWIRWHDNKKAFSSIKLPFHHIKAELVSRVLPGTWRRICDQHILRIKLLNLFPNLVLFSLTVETPAMLVVNGFTNFHVQSWHAPTKTSVAAKEFNHITLASLTKPVSLLTKVSFSIFSDIWFVVIFFFSCKWNRFWTIKSRDSNIIPFIMITSDLWLVDTHDSTIAMNIDHSTFLWDNSTSDPSFLLPGFWWRNGVSIDRGRPNENLITWIVRSVWWHRTFSHVMPEVSSLSSFLMCLQCFWNLTVWILLTTCTCRCRRFWFNDLRFIISFNVQFLSNPHAWDRNRKQHPSV